MKKLFLLIPSFAFLPLFSQDNSQAKIPQYQDSRARPALNKNRDFSQDDVQRDINKLINQNDMLKKEVERLSSSKVGNPEIEKMSILVSEKDDKIAELEKQVEYLGTSLVNVLKTFEANINAKGFSKVLKENLSKLDSKESAKLVNEAMANALYRLKFMYTEARYLLNWTNGKINWKAAAEKGIKVPVFNDTFSENEIKNMVMAVTVD